ncbi:hypothetical protein BDW59DRAFT_54045 [Aspergillus cavernicola]|uniref:Uncharacterized protein n=1 Tax=Aspergillus cavernicola TaxID=176166 RepID=A0ABR4ILI0_9EURO
MPRAKQSPPGPKPDKNMSSRLLTMKFMQRAAASAATNKESQPESPSESTNSTPKKRRVSSGPESPTATPSSDLEAISAALAEEESRRRDAISRQAAEAGETEWILDFGGADSVGQYAQPPPVLKDYSLDADDDEMGYGGRQAYGNYKPKKKPKPSGDGQDGGANSENRPPRTVNLNNVTSISGAGGRGPPKTFGGNDKSQKKRKHK